VSSVGQPKCLEGTEMNLLRQRVSMIVFFLFAFGIPWTTWIALRMRHLAFPEATFPSWLAQLSAAWEAWSPPT
jgi:hypothetical protein